MVWGIDGLMNGVWNSNARSVRSISPAAPLSHMSADGQPCFYAFSSVPARFFFPQEIMAPHSMSFAWSELDALGRLVRV